MPKYVDKHGKYISPLSFQEKKKKQRTRRILGKEINLKLFHIFIMQWLPKVWKRNLHFVQKVQIVKKIGQLKEKKN